MFLLAGQFSRAQTIKTFTIPANKSFAEPYEPERPGIRIPVSYPTDTAGTVTHWVNPKRSLVWYLYQKPGSYQFFINTTVQKDKNINFELRISPCAPVPAFANIAKKVTLKGNGNTQSNLMADVVIPATNYYRYELKPLSSPVVIEKIEALVFKSASAGAHVNQTEYQSTPSVHLSFSSTEPSSKKYDWIYQEILVPKGGDPLGTYYMSLGFFRGYMGIQTNSPNERRVLFSVWDSKDAEHDKDMKKDDYVTLVDRGEGTTTNSFGGEGTGGQSYIKGANWQTGKPVKFLMNILKQPNNTVVISAWYKIDNSDWIYVASWRAPKEQRVFNGFYSFLENFDYTNGHLRREAYYYNAWGLDTASKKWINFNKVGFSNTDGRIGQRVDFEQGVSKKYPDRFYMAAGAFTPTVKTANQIPLAKERFSLDLGPFIARVKQALAKEEKNRKR